MSTSEPASTSAQKPYGYVVKYERRKPPMLTETALFRRKGGTEKAARKAAIFKIGFIRVISVDPYTAEEWERAFGQDQRM